LGTYTSRGVRKEKKNISVCLVQTKEIKTKKQPLPPTTTATASSSTLAIYLSIQSDLSIYSSVYYIPLYTMAVPSVVTLDAWKQLAKLHEQTKDLHMRDLFAQNPDRFKTFSREACGILLDFSKNRITEDVFSRLVELANQANLKASIDQMFSGSFIYLSLVP